MRATTDLVPATGGRAKNKQLIEGDIFLSESTVRTSLKITSTVAAALAFSWPVPVARWRTRRADASGRGDAGSMSVARSFPCRLRRAHFRRPRLQRPKGSVRMDTPLGSADGGVQTGFGVGLPTLPPPPALPRLRLQTSEATSVGVITPLGRPTWSPDRLRRWSPDTAPPPPLPRLRVGPDNLGFGF